VQCLLFCSQIIVAGANLLTECYYSVYLPSSKQTMDSENIVLFTIEIPDDERRHHSHKISILTVDDSFFLELEGSLQFDNASIPSLQASSSSFPTLATCSVVDQSPIRPHRKASIAQDIFNQVFSQEHNDEFFTSCRSHFTQQSPRWFTASHGSIDKSITDSIIRSRTNVQEIFDHVFSTGSHAPDITVVDISNLGQRSIASPQVSKLERKLWSSFENGKEHNNASTMLSDQKRPPHHPKRKPTLTDSIVVLIDLEDNAMYQEQGLGSGISSCKSIVNMSIPAVISPSDNKNVPVLSPLTIKSSSRGGSTITPSDTKNVLVLSSLTITSPCEESLSPPVAFSLDQHLQGRSNRTAFVALPWFDTPSISSLSSFLSTGNIADDDDDGAGDGDGKSFLGNQAGEINSGSDKAKSNDESVNPIKEAVLASRESSILHSLYSKQERWVANVACGWNAAAAGAVGNNENVRDAPVPAPVPLRTLLPTTLRVAIDSRDTLLLPPRRKPSILDWRSIEFTSSLPSLPEEESAVAHDYRDKEEKEGYFIEPDLYLSTKEDSARKSTRFSRPK